jgi:hypothetical protein
MRAGAEAIEPGRQIAPRDLARHAFDRYGGSRLGGIERCAGVQDAANRATTVMGMMTALVALSGSGAWIGLTDARSGEWIGCGQARGPAGPDRCKNLHQQSNQDYRQIILEPPAHHKPIPEQLTTPLTPSRDRYAALGIASATMLPCVAALH